METGAAVPCVVAPPAWVVVFSVCCADCWVVVVSSGFELLCAAVVVVVVVSEEASEESAAELDAELELSAFFDESLAEELSEQPVSIAAATARIDTISASVRLVFFMFDYPLFLIFYFLYIKHSALLAVSRLFYLFAVSEYTESYADKVLLYTPFFKQCLSLGRFKYLFASVYPA